MVHRRSSISLSILILIPLFASPVVGEWETDTWVSNVIGPERIENGDEFGCHGYEGVDTLLDNWVIKECKEYLMELTDSSRWGEDPVSFGIDGETLDDSTATSLQQSGFIIVGDRLIDAPEEVVVITRNGGSLEKGVADIEILENADRDSLVSIHWRARVGDLRVRDDGDVISWLENQQVWLTTWGEWHFHRISGESTKVTVEGEKLFSVSDTSERWAVPGTIYIQFGGNVTSVSDSSGIELPILSHDVRKLQIGWRPVEGGILLTQSPGSNITIELDKEPELVEAAHLVTFNGLHHGVTVVGHHTSNLFRWTQDFSGSELTFTWLIERPVADAISWVMPVVAISILVAAPASIYYLINSDKDMILNDQEE